eukprot:ANDGO_06472.mRNA.1 hypothetical protein
MSRLLDGACKCIYVLRSKRIAFGVDESRCVRILPFTSSPISLCNSGVQCVQLCMLHNFAGSMLVMLHEDRSITTCFVRGSFLQRKMVAEESILSFVSGSAHEVYADCFARRFQYDELCGGTRLSATSSTENVFVATASQYIFVFIGRQCTIMKVLGTEMVSRQLVTLSKIVKSVASFCNEELYVLLEDQSLCVFDSATVEFTSVCRIQACESIFCFSNQLLLAMRHMGTESKSAMASIVRLPSARRKFSSDCFTFCGSDTTAVPLDVVSAFSISNSDCLYFPFCGATIRQNPLEYVPPATAGSVVVCFPEVGHVFTFAQSDSLSKIPRHLLATYIPLDALALSDEEFDALIQQAVTEKDEGMLRELLAVAAKERRKLDRWIAPLCEFPRIAQSIIRYCVEVSRKIPDAVSGKVTWSEMPGVPRLEVPIVEAPIFGDAQSTHVSGLVREIIAGSIDLRLALELSAQWGFSYQTLLRLILMSPELVHSVIHPDLLSTIRNAPLLLLTKADRPSSKEFVKMSDTEALGMWKALRTRASLPMVLRDSEFSSLVLEILMSSSTSEILSILHMPFREEYEWRACTLFGAAVLRCILQRGGELLEYVANQLTLGTGAKDWQLVDLDSIVGSQLAAPFYLDFALCFWKRKVVLPCEFHRLTAEPHVFAQRWVSDSSIWDLCVRATEEVLTRMREVFPRGQLSQLHIAALHVLSDHRRFRDCVQYMQQFDLIGCARDAALPSSIRFLFSTNGWEEWLRSAVSVLGDHPVASLFLSTADELWIPYASAPRAENALPQFLMAHSDAALKLPEVPGLLIPFELLVFGNADGTDLWTFCKENAFRIQVPLLDDCSIVSYRLIAKVLFSILANSRDYSLHLRLLKFAELSNIIEFLIPALECYFSGDSVQNCFLKLEDVSASPFCIRFYSSSDSSTIPPVRALSADTQSVWASILRSGEILSGSRLQWNYLDAVFRNQDEQVMLSSGNNDINSALQLAFFTHILGNPPRMQDLPCSVGGVYVLANIPGMDLTKLYAPSCAQEELKAPPVRAEDIVVPDAFKTAESAFDAVSMVRYVDCGVFLWYAQAVYSCHMKNFPKAHKCFARFHAANPSLLLWIPVIKTTAAVLPDQVKFLFLKMISPYFPQFLPPHFDVFENGLAPLSMLGLPQEDLILYFSRRHRFAAARKLSAEWGTFFEVLFLSKCNSFSRAISTGFHHFRYHTSPLLCFLLLLISRENPDAVLIACLAYSLLRDQKDIVKECFELAFICREPEVIRFVLETFLRAHSAEFPVKYLEECHIDVECLTDFESDNSEMFSELIGLLRIGTAKETLWSLMERDRTTWSIRSPGSGASYSNPITPLSPPFSSSSSPSMKTKLVRNVSINALILALLSDNDDSQSEMFSFHRIAHDCYFAAKEQFPDILRLFTDVIVDRPPLHISLGSFHELVARVLLFPCPLISQQPVWRLLRGYAAEHPSVCAVWEDSLVMIWCDFIRAFVYHDASLATKGLQIPNLAQSLKVDSSFRRSSPLSIVYSALLSLSSVLTSNKSIFAEVASEENEKSIENIRGVFLDFIHSLSVDRRRFLELMEKIVVSWDGFPSVLGLLCVMFAQETMGFSFAAQRVWEEVNVRFSALLAKVLVDGDAVQRSHIIEHFHILSFAVGDVSLLLPYLDAIAAAGATPELFAFEISLPLARIILKRYPQYGKSVHRVFARENRMQEVAFRLEEEANEHPSVEAFRIAAVQYHLAGNFVRSHEIQSSKIPLLTLSEEIGRDLLSLTRDDARVFVRSANSPRHAHVVCVAYGLSPHEEFASVLFDRFFKKDDTAFIDQFVAYFRNRVSSTEWRHWAWSALDALKTAGLWNERRAFQFLEAACPDILVRKELYKRIGDAGRYASEIKKLDIFLD